MQGKLGHYPIPELAFQLYSEIIAQPVLSLTFSIANKVTSIIFIGLQLALFLVRRLPVAKLGGWLPRLVTIIAANGAAILIFLPNARASSLLVAVSSVLLIGGTVGAIIVLCFLGRSFSILPQARGLVVSGPYRFVRHPLYLMEQVGLTGIMLRYRQASFAPAVHDGGLCKSEFTSQFLWRDAARARVSFRKAEKGVCLVMKSPLVENSM